MANYVRRPTKHHKRQYCSTPGCPDYPMHREEVNGDTVVVCAGHHSNNFNAFIAGTIKNFRYIERIH